MKLSAHTIDVLKNFNTINQGILIKEGSVLQTISMRSNIFVTAKVSETFDREFAIYDLSEFLNILPLFEDAELKFEDSHILIQSSAKGDRRKAKYFYASPEVVVSPPEKKISFQDSVVSFNLSEDVLTSIQKASAVMKLKHIFITDGVITINNTKSSGNQFSYDIPMETTSDEVDYIINTENLKLITADYRVEIAPNGISRFTNEDLNIEYYIALDTE